MSHLRERLLTLPTAILYEAAGKLGDMDPTIKPIAPGTRMAGTAFTVKCMIGDMSAAVRALEVAEPGQVLVIDGGGSYRGTIWGGTSTKAAVKRGLAGCVTNASARDSDEIRASGFPVFAAGISVRGVILRHPGWHGIPVSVGEVSVHPGDWIVGDSDGVVVVPAADADAVFERAFARLAMERDWDRRVRNGETMASVINMK
jgi:4-hydroxy-4-methyl-2-oxoglutarate aldolase